MVLKMLKSKIGASRCASCAPHKRAKQETGNKPTTRKKYIIIRVRFFLIIGVFPRAATVVKKTT